MSTSTRGIPGLARPPTTNARAEGKGATQDYHGAIGINRCVSESIFWRILRREYCRECRAPGFDQVSDNATKEFLFMAMFLTIKAGGRRTRTKTHHKRRPRRRHR